MKACREENYPIVAAFVRAGYRCLLMSYHLLKTF